MKERVFVDTDLVLDVLAQREPFYDHSAQLFSKAERGAVELYVSALTFANAHYLLSKQYSARQSRSMLLHFKTLVTVLSMSDKAVERALTSEFADFEDGLQYFTAIEAGISLLLTRNLKDYKPAEIAVMSAEQYIKSAS